MASPTVPKVGSPEEKGGFQKSQKIVDGLLQGNQIIIIIIFARKLAFFFKSCGQLFQGVEVTLLWRVLCFLKIILCIQSKFEARERFRLKDHDRKITSLRSSPGSQTGGGRTAFLSLGLVTKI